MVEIVNLFKSHRPAYLIATLKFPVNVIPKVGLSLIHQDKHVIKIQGVVVDVYRDDNLWDCLLNHDDYGLSKGDILVIQ